MEHIEVHTIASARDTELAQLAGLIRDDTSNFLDMECEMCGTIFKRLDSCAFIVLCGDKEVVSCDLCLGLALTFVLP
jgi:hypothetical protein